VTDAATGHDALLHRTVEYFAAHGIGDVSLRRLADEIGTSHRMLIYHFGSRDGLLAAVVDAVEANGRSTLVEIAAQLGPSDDPLAAGLLFWHAITDEALVFGPLFFELSSHAMRALPHARVLRDRLVTTWVHALAETWTARGVAQDEARAYARLDLAVARGLLHDLLLTGDRKVIDDLMRNYAEAAISARLAG
jgi:AcrR family transcriptional regulator